MKHELHSARLRPQQYWHPSLALASVAFFHCQGSRSAQGLKFQHACPFSTPDLGMDQDQDSQV